MLAFYNIPEPASAAIEADIPAATADAGGPAEAPRSDSGSSQFGGDAPAPRSDPAASESQPQRNLQRATDPAPPTQPEPRTGETTEVPRFLMPSSGGATIVSFDWIDCSDDFVGTDGRLIAPGGGKDEHFRLVMELPPAATIEEFAITGGPVRWTTKPTPRCWPVAVVGNQELKNRRQSLQVGGFSGRWAFDLYAESEPSIRPGQAFGVEVVVLNRDSRHRVTARCERK
jgi:hypothetical protein